MNDEQVHDRGATGIASGDSLMRGPGTGGGPKSELIGPTGIEKVLRRCFERFVIPWVSDPLMRQRLKMLWYAWGYWSILALESLSRRDRLRILSRFLKVDWNVVHAHLPREMAYLCEALVQRGESRGEVVVEAGCWKGGGSAKLSIICKILDLRLFIYDSFQGVETLPPEEQRNEWSFAGEYASPEWVLRDNLARYGEPSMCVIHKGWFSETLARHPVSCPVRLAYIDCDLGKGTLEALMGILPSMRPEGIVFSQDYHIEPVRRVLQDPATWLKFGRGMPEIVSLGQYLARITFSCRLQDEGQRREKAGG